MMMINDAMYVFVSQMWLAVFSGFFPYSRNLVVFLFSDTFHIQAILSDTFLTQGWVEGGIYVCLLVTNAQAW